MKRTIRKAVGRPDNSMFAKRFFFYILLTVAMLLAPSVFGKIMEPMAAEGIREAWDKVFVPLALFMMAIGLFRCWRRRWPLAYMNHYNKQAKENGYEYCPRCGEPLALKRRSRFHREKVGELVTTTRYSDGSKTVDRKDVYENVRRTNYYYECTNKKCALEVDKKLSHSHLPWRVSQIECLVLNDDRLLSHKYPSASHLLLSRLFVPFLALVVVAVSGFTVYNYADSHEGDWTFASADRQVSRSAEEYQAFLLSLDTAHRNWHVAYESKPSDMMSYLKESFLKQDIGSEYSMECYNTEKGTVLFYCFEGNDAGTGLPDGDYTLMQLNGVNVLLDDSNEIIYKQGSEFYETYAPKLMALTYDKVLGEVLARVDGGEHAMSDMDMEFMRKDQSTVYAYMLSGDLTKISGSEFRAVTLHPEENTIEQWFFSYDDTAYTPDDPEDYVESNTGRA
ncbi:MAG: hypothetical protein IJF71_06645 [Clostridia bacterium]|nr:hypothetical protein [Clostridia bacterium]